MIHYELYKCWNLYCLEHYDYETTLIFLDCLMISLKIWKKNQIANAVSNQLFYWIQLVKFFALNMKHMNIGIYLYIYM